jgi:HEPN domain-containing protein
MITREDNPDHWFLLGRERLESADVLVKARGPCYSSVELLQESVERYLKGYLIGRGWRLERIHDLNRLLDLCIGYDSRIERFVPLAQSLTEQFWAQHYPGDDLSEVGWDYEELRALAGELISIVGNSRAREQDSPPGR